MHICAYDVAVAYEWDRAKAGENLRKHRVDFADAVGVFEDPQALTIADNEPSEERFITIGLDLLARILVVSWTSRRHGEHIRIISARKANKYETRQYVEEEKP